ncbi:MAG: CAP domain-containing protein [Pseudomonadota bacterium]
MSLDPEFGRSGAFTLKYLTGSLLAIGLIGQAHACDMQTEAREDMVSAYVKNGVICLQVPPGEFRFDADLEAMFAGKINTERRKRGLTELQVRPEILPAARFHSLDMGVNQYFDHISPKGRAAVYRVTAFDRTLLAQSTAENIAVFGPTRCVNQEQEAVPCSKAMGFEPPEPDFIVRNLHQKLMQSDGHRANILNEDTTHFAVGVARTETGFYVTQVFVKQRGALNQSLPTRIALNDTIPVAPEIDGWGFGNFIIVDPDGEKTDLENSQLTGVETGAKTLFVRGKNVTREQLENKIVQRTELLELRGPAFNAVPAKGS